MAAVAKSTAVGPQFRNTRALSEPLWNVQRTRYHQRRQTTKVRMAGTRAESNAQAKDLPTRKAELSKTYDDWKKSFPAVQAVTCQELQDMIKTNPDVVLVDVRAPDEQNVSVLPGHVVLKEDFDPNCKAYADKHIVTYCTVGVRSGKYAQQLIDQGLPHVYNLKGSIVAWSQEGYPLVKNDGKQTPTKQVHTFGKTWDLVGDGYESVQFGAIQGSVELARSVLPRAFGGR